MNSLYWAIIRLSRSNSILRFLIDYLALGFYSIFRHNCTFLFQNSRYKYYYHLYNRTVAGERIVELPIAFRLLDKYKGKSILEVGNVISHYRHVTHDILDKYEVASGVINQDIIEFNPPQRYDLIISISTLEHVGRDYGEEYSPEKFNAAVRNLKKLLSRKGQLFVTLPVSFNLYLYKLIMSHKMPFTKESYLQRSSFLNDWVQIPFSKVKAREGYDNYYANANCIYVGQYFKK